MGSGCDLLTPLQHFFASWQQGHNASHKGLIVYTDIVLGTFFTDNQ